MIRSRKFDGRKVVLVAVLAAGFLVWVVMR